MLPLLVSAIGLGVEIGGWYAAVRSLQNTADAAAVAAVFELRGISGTVDSTTDLLPRATTEAVRNGLDTSNGDTITLNYYTEISPSSYTTDYSTNTTAVEVILTKSVALYFVGWITDDNTITANAQAVAINLSLGDGCVLALDTSGSAIDVGGSASAVFDGCVTVSNSADADALAATGSGTLVADCYYAVGGVSDTSQMTFDSDCTPVTNGSAIADPYADLTDPDDGNCDYSGNYTKNTATTETFTGSGSFTDPYVICGDFWVKKGTLTLTPGLYVIKGDIKTNSSGSLNGSGATIVLKDGGQINNFNGSSTLNLSAPTASDTSSEWKGILFYQDRDSTSSCTGNNCNTINGNSSSTFQGVVYFPNQEIYINGGNETTATCLQIVALRIGFSGGGTVNADNSCSSSGVTPIEIPIGVRLVE